MDSLPETIYVVGYRRSGTVWLSHLLGDALNCSIGGSIPAWDATDIATYGTDRISPYQVRRGHFLVVKNSRETNGHIMTFNVLRKSKIFFIVRDPRDVIVSVAHYWRIPINSALEWVVEGKSEMARTGNWREFIESWLDSELNFHRISYEMLYRDPTETLKNAMLDAKLPINAESLKLSVERNDYLQRRVRIITDEITHTKGRAFLFRHMVQPAVGEWKNFMLNTGMLAKLEVNFGNIMSYFRYECQTS